MKTKNLNKLAKAILNKRYLEKTAWLSDEELAEILKLIVEKSGKDVWQLILHENVEHNYTWYELELSDDWPNSSYQRLEWLNYTR